MEGNKKIIINVGRQIGSGGRIIAKMLADDLKCGFYDRELLSLAAKESGFCEKFFEQNDEQKGFFHSLFHMHTPFVGDGSFYDNDFSPFSIIFSASSSWHSLRLRISLMRSSIDAVMKMFTTFS